MHHVSFVPTNYRNKITIIDSGHEYVVNFRCADGLNDILLLHNTAKKTTLTYCMLQNVVHCQRYYVPVIRCLHPSSPGTRVSSNPAQTSRTP